MRFPRINLGRASAFLGAAIIPAVARAATFGGGSIQDGLPLAEAIRTGNSTDIRTAVLTMLFQVLRAVGTIAVVVLVIAGIMLVIGGYSDETRERVKKIVLYTILGLLLIIVSSTLVALILYIGTGYYSA